MKSQLLCTFSTVEKLKHTLSSIKSSYELIYNYIYVLSNEDDDNELYITYNINPQGSSFKVLNTISIHRKKETNTLYTINSLNRLILHETGVMDPTYQLDWTQYKNSIILLDGDYLSIIPTQIYDIIKL